MTTMVASGLAIACFAASVGVGLVFLTAGMEKFRHRALLPGVIANYRLLPQRLVAPVSAMLPIAEMAVGAALLVGFTPAPVLAAMLLLGLFAGAMAINILRGRRHIHCGCGRAELQQSLGWPLVARNLLLIALIVPRLGVTQPLGLAEIVMAAAGGLLLFLAYTLLHSIGALIASPRASILAPTRR
ncbi:hypothetical protein BH10PSE13_BH10PSE13_10960 [soil metagenome]